MTQGFLTATPFVLLFLVEFGEKAFLHLKMFVLEVSLVNFICIANQPYRKSYLNAPKANQRQLWQGKELQTCNATGVIKYLVGDHDRDHDNSTNVQLYDPNFLLLSQKRT